MSGEVTEEQAILCAQHLDLIYSQVAHFIPSFHMLLGPQMRIIALHLDPMLMAWWVLFLQLLPHISGSTRSTSSI